MHRKQPSRRTLAVLAASLSSLSVAGPALACAGLVTPGGNVSLLRTATLAAWHDGLEHYVTAFTFSGGGAEVGSLVPLPGIPSKVERGGDWTLQRLERETQRVRSADAEGAALAASPPAEVVYETRIDALDITILKGGGESVGAWAEEHGFSLTPDAPEVLEFYAARSPVFMAARFNTEAAKERNQQQGEGTPIHLTIPLAEPWVPLRVLGLGRAADERIDADVYLLTPGRPALLPAPGEGVQQLRSEAASTSLLDDLRSDKGMEWMPEQMWLTYLRIAEQASDLRYDLAIDAAGDGEPSRVAAGLEPPPSTPQATTTPQSTTTTAPATTTTTRARPLPPTSSTVTTSPPASPTTQAAPAEGRPPVAVTPQDTVYLEREVALAGGRTSSRQMPLSLAASLVGATLASGATVAVLRLRRRQGGGVTPRSRSER